GMKTPPARKRKVCAHFIRRAAESQAFRVEHERNAPPGRRQHLGGLLGQGQGFLEREKVRQGSLTIRPQERRLPLRRKFSSAYELPDVQGGAQDKDSRAGGNGRGEETIRLAAALVQREVDARLRAGNAPLADKAKEFADRLTKVREIYRQLRF